MARQVTRRVDKAVRDEMMRLLEEHVINPTGKWDPVLGTPDVERAAGFLLTNAGFFDQHGCITLAGMDYYRKETANPVLKWLWSNWFAVIVAGCTIGVSVWGIVGG